MMFLGLEHQGGKETHFLQPKEVRLILHPCDPSLRNVARLVMKSKGKDLLLAVTCITAVRKAMGLNKPLIQVDFRTPFLGKNGERGPKTSGLGRHSKPKNLNI